jgi:aryl-alcohol dehydrogenase-like predicted oxidoreductase
MVSLYSLIAHRPELGRQPTQEHVAAVDASLKRLKADYIDLYWGHIWDQMTPVEEVMRGLDDLEK